MIICTLSVHLYIDYLYICTYVHMIICISVHYLLTSVHLLIICTSVNQYIICWHLYICQPPVHLSTICPSYTDGTPVHHIHLVHLYIWYICPSYTDGTPVHHIHLVHLVHHIHLYIMYTCTICQPPVHLYICQPSVNHLYICTSDRWLTDVIFISVHLTDGWQMYRCQQIMYWLTDVQMYRCTSDVQMYRCTDVNIC